MQMEQGTTKPTIHPIKLLALAYGLMPEVAVAVDHPGRGVDRHMNVRVRLFAVARAGRRPRLASSSSCPRGPPSASCAAGWPTQIPQLSGAGRPDDVRRRHRVRRRRDVNPARCRRGLYPAGQRRVEWTESTCLRLQVITVTLPYDPTRPNNPIDIARRRPGGPLAGGRGGRAVPGHGAAN